jgi:hypothetical protein
MSGIRKAILAFPVPPEPPEPFDEQAVAAVSAIRAAATAVLGRSFFTFSSDEGATRHGGHRVTVVLT